MPRHLIINNLKIRLTINVFSSLDVTLHTDPVMNSISDEKDYFLQEPTLKSFPANIKKTDMRFQDQLKHNDIKTKKLCLFVSIALSFHYSFKFIRVRRASQYTAHGD